jgi:hypothetical protein
MRNSNSLRDRIQKVGIERTLAKGPAPSTYSDLGAFAARPLAVQFGSRTAHTRTQSDTYTSTTMQQHTRFALQEDTQSRAKTVRACLFCYMGCFSFNERSCFNIISYAMSAKCLISTHAWQGSGWNDDDDDFENFDDDDQV